MARKSKTAVPPVPVPVTVSAPVAKAQAVAGKALEKVPAPSPNPMTNLIITDLVLRGGGQIMRQAVERTLLGAKYSPGKARNIVKGRTMTQTLIGTAIARVAMRSVPGAIIVGGALLAKTLYDRARSPHEAQAEGEQAIAVQARKGKP